MTWLFIGMAAGHGIFVYADYGDLRGLAIIFAAFFAVFIDAAYRAPELPDHD